MYLKYIEVYRSIYLILKYIGVYNIRREMILVNMNKKNNRIIVAILSMIIVLTVWISYSNISASDSGEEHGKRLKETYQEQKESEIINEEILYLQGELNKLYADLEKEMCVSLDKDSRIETYNDAYGGAYIDENYLVVCVTSDCLRSTIDSEKIIYRKVEKTYNELLRTKTSLREKYQDLYDELVMDNSESPEFEAISSIAGIGIDCKQNTVFCDVVNLDNKKEAMLFSLFPEAENIIWKNVSDESRD